MKFSIALAGILAQPFSTTADLKVEHVTRSLNGPAAAGTSGFKHPRPLRSLGVSRNRNHHGGPVLSRRVNYQNKDLPLRNLHSLSLEDVGKPCDPSSLDPDVGILSCGKGSLCKPNGISFLGGTCVDAQGILKNQLQQETFPITECDPTSTDTADVGVLVCGEGQRCIPSAASDMGGFCESSSLEDADTSSRELVWLLAEGGMCNSTHPNYGFYDCDCSQYDISTGTGSVACTAPQLCLGIAYNGCNDLCVDKQVLYTFENFQTPIYTQCTSTAQGAPTPQEFCLTESFDDQSCEVKLNGEVCSSCNVTLAPPTYPRYYTTVNFDCTNVEGGSYGDAYYLNNLLPVIAECFEPIDNAVACELCPGENNRIYSPYEIPANRMVDIEGYGTFLCESLVPYAYNYPSIGEDTCSALVTALNSTCCTTICDICPTGGTLNADATANFLEVGEVSCGYLTYFLTDPTQCAEAKPLLVDACCGLPVTTPAPSMGDGEGATPGPTEEVSTSPPEEGDGSDDNFGGEITPPPTGENNADTAADGASSVALSTLSALMMIGSAGSLMTYFAIY